MNRRKQTGTSRFKGVCWHKKAGKWQAKIQHNFVRIRLGLFSSEEDAARAYNRKAKELFGEFAKLNEITPLF